MAILRIRDKDGNVHEILAIRGENYVLTEQDKEEIASMISDSDGNGNFSALTDHKNNTSNPHGVTAEQIGAVTQEELEEALANVGGVVGTTFIPSVSEDGTISWTNNGNLPNPEPVNIKGKDGVDGKDGISATHSWNGTVLTVTSASGTSSADLKGEKGDTGSKGEKGDKGDPGKDGQNGIDGQPGADGYTPVKGIDYWTEADRTQMVADVIAALPVYSGEVV